MVQCCFQRRVTADVEVEGLFNGKPEPLDDKRPDRENGGRIPGLSAGDTDANRSPTIPSQWNQQLRYRCANLTAQITVRKLYYLTTVTVMFNLTMILLWTSIQVLWSVMRIHENIFLGELNVPYKSSERQLTNYWIRAPPLVGGDDAGQERWRVSRNAVEDDRWLWNVWKYQLTGVKRMMWVRLT